MCKLLYLKWFFENYDKRFFLVVLVRTVTFLIVSEEKQLNYLRKTLSNDLLVSYFDEVLLIFQHQTIYQLPQRVDTLYYARMQRMGSPLLWGSRQVSFKIYNKQFFEIHFSKSMWIVFLSVGKIQRWYQVNFQLSKPNNLDYSSFKQY